MKTFAEIRQQLQAKTGISSLFLQDDALKLAVQKRCEHLRCPDAQSYCNGLEGSEAEWRQLIEEVVVSETWFLRDEKPFEFLAQHAKREWLGHSQKRRILSAPCATGEEPYSIAIKLLQAGFTQDDFAIDALDISERALEIARQRTYRASAFRGNGLELSEHFEKIPEGGYRISKAFERVIQFRRANLLDSGSFVEGARYNVIFCRNLLIYLDDPSRHELLTIIEGLLEKNGLLFVGHADAGAIAGRRLQPCGPSNAFVFQEREPAQKPAKSATASFDPAPEKKRVLTPLKAVQSPVLPASWIPPKPVDAKVDLKQATELANAGKLREAGALCDEYLKAHPLCPNGTHLLAVLRLASGAKEQAEQLFNRVTYLDPAHIEALLHLERLAEMRGDRTSAESWRRRIQHHQPHARP